MKKIFTLFSTVLLSIAVFAAAPKAKTMLTIQSQVRADLRVVIDGRRFEPNSNFMRLQGLQAGYHTVTIYREKTGGIFNMMGKRYERIFSSSITLRQRTNLVMTVDRFGRTSLKETRFDGWNNGGGNGRNNRYDDRSYDRGRDNGWGEDYRQGQDFDYDVDGRLGDYDWNNGYSNDRFGNAISDREFSRVIQGMENEWLEANKMKSATQIISTNYLTSAQVRQMMQLFSMENNKVDLAKQAYGKTVDQRNFLSTISDQFSFSNSRDELARYIRNFR
ncbi:MAG TPA: DUF4476 domain-containing protein [Chitinophagaceae bacterium]